jgi:hypothetical protein
LGLTILGHNLRTLAELREKKQEPDDAVTAEIAA